MNTIYTQIKLLARLVELLEMQDEPPDDPETLEGWGINGGLGGGRFRINEGQIAINDAQIYSALEALRDIITEDPHRMHISSKIAKRVLKELGEIPE